jgi:hypothetical protein
MKVSYPKKSSTVRSWDRNDKTTLNILFTEDGALLQHIDDRFMATQTTLTQLTVPEALELAQRMFRVLSGFPALNPAKADNEPCFNVTPTTDGEPYREGVSLALDTGNWHSDFTFSMDKDTAREVACALHDSQE